MEQIINEFMVSLAKHVPEEHLKTIRDHMIIFFKDYDITKKKNEIIPRMDDLDRELKAYLVTIKIEGKSDKTIKQYALSLSKMLGFINKQPKDITTADLQYYLYQLEQTTGMKPISLDNQRVIMSAFFSWLVNNDYIQKNPCANIRAIKHEKNTRHYLTAVQMESLREVCETLRDKAMIEFAYATGCRVEEMTRVKLSDINFETKEVELFGKGKKHRISYLNARALVAIQSYLKTRQGDSEYLFCSYRKPYDGLKTRNIEQIFKDLGNKAGFHVTPHLIRHTTATDAIDHGMPVEQVQKLLGHESISTTLIYAETKQDNVRNGHQKFII